MQRALAIEPSNLKALALSGSAAFDRRDYATAVRQWEQVRNALPPDSGFLAQVNASIAQARELGGLPASGAASTASASAADNATTQLAAAAVRGTLSLAPALQARAAPDDTVFIVARPADGSRMPLAVLRKQVRDLPLEFTLDDSLAMAPTARISDHRQVVVRGARQQERAGPAAGGRPERRVGAGGTRNPGTADRDRSGGGGRSGALTSIGGCAEWVDFRRKRPLVLCGGDCFAPRMRDNS